MVETQLKRQGRAMFDVISGTGANEVIIETPIHNIDFDVMPAADVASVIKIYRDRMNDLKKDDRIEYILVFKNRGRYAGSITGHLYSQLMAMPVIPKKVQDEIDEAFKHYSEKKRCIYCDMLDNELLLKERVIWETRHFIVIAPFASQSCFETMIMPKEHAAHFMDISQEQTIDLAETMKRAIGAINKALNRPSYNYMLHTAPVKTGQLGHYHWHIEIVPRVKEVSGFETGSGFSINPVLPEDAAAYLRGL